MNFYFCLLLKLTRSRSREPGPEPKLRHSGSSTGSGPLRLRLQNAVKYVCKTIFSASWRPLFESQVFAWVAGRAAWSIPPPPPRPPESRTEKQTKLPLLIELFQETIEKKAFMTVRDKRTGIGICWISHLSAVAWVNNNEPFDIC